MIVPESRLIRWVAFVVLPFALLSAIVPGAILVAAAAIGALLLLVLIDAALAPGRLTGLAIELPPLTRLSKDRPGALEVRIRNQQARSREVRVGLPWPAEFDAPAYDQVALLPGGSELSRLTWLCTPLRRGRFLLERAYVEALSPLGFWAVRAVARCQGEIRVYPNLLAERRRVAALFLHRGSFGAHVQRQVGKGRQFEGLREYVPGDGFDEIHWKATAKRGRPVSKVFQIERTQEVYVVIDSSRLSSRLLANDHSATSARRVPPDHERPERNEGGSQPPRGTAILERFITSALVLGLAAQRQGDLFGLVAFNDKVQEFVRAKNGREHYNQCREALYALQPQTVTPDFEELGTFLRLRLRRRALLVFLTSLDDPVLAESFLRSVELLRRQHLLLVNMMQPPGARALFSDPNVSSLDELYEHLGGHLLWHDLQEFGKVLERRGVRLALLQDESMSAQLISQYLSVKQRQLL
jgi:uncharacterized protein (DUF58 family)